MKTSAEALPSRVRRSRERGWRTPLGTRYVGRPTRFGNPFRLNDPVTGLVRDLDEPMQGRTWDYEHRSSGPGRNDLVLLDGRTIGAVVRWATPAELVELFNLAVHRTPTWGMQMAMPADHDGSWSTPDVATIREVLTGQDLSCWCALSAPCHVDVYLHLANADLNPDTPHA